jgi:uncharacterized protein YbaP (TraB family)
MQRRIGVIAGLFAGLIGLPSLAAAQCAGEDQLAVLAAENPAAHEEVLSRAEQVPNGHGLFWRIEQGGAPPSYLFGTFHDTEAATLPLGAAVSQALQGARVMLVEVTDEDQARMRARMTSDPAFAFGGRPVAISDRLDARGRAEAELALSTLGLNLALADRLRPALLMSILAQPQCALEAMASGKSVLDSVLMARAAESGIPVRGMETYEAALASIDTLDPEVTGPLIVEALANLDALEDFRRTALELYEAGDIAVLREFEKWQAEQDLGVEETQRLFGALTASVIDGRNHSWMAVMAPELEQGGVFAAFGAMHLIGEQGVVELLRARGFTVTRAGG